MQAMRREWLVSEAALLLALLAPHIAAIPVKSGFRLHRAALMAACGPIRFNQYVNFR